MGTPTRAHTDTHTHTRTHTHVHTYTYTHTHRSLSTLLIDASPFKWNGRWFMFCIQPERRWVGCGDSLILGAGCLKTERATLSLSLTHTLSYLLHRWGSGGHTIPWACGPRPPCPTGGGWIWGLVSCLGPDCFDLLAPHRCQPPDLWSSDSHGAMESLLLVASRTL
jgi:hypothetical protein